MQPTINPNPINVDGKLYQDGVYVRLTQDVTYGDIIIVDRSQETGQRNYTVIKRVMALEGDQVSIVSLPVGENGSYEFRLIRIKAGDNVDQIVYDGVDNEYILYEEYINGYVGPDSWEDTGSIYIEDVRYDYDFYATFLINQETTTHNVIVNGQSIPVLFFTVGSDKSENEPDQVFYLGDNRAYSEDSRNNGTCDIDKVVGKVIKILRNSYSLRTSPWSWVEKVYEFFAIIWEEIINYFTV